MGHPSHTLHAHLEKKIQHGLRLCLGPALNTSLSFLRLSFLNLFPQQPPDLVGHPGHTLFFFLLLQSQPWISWKGRIPNGLPNSVLYVSTQARGSACQVGPHYRALDPHHPSAPQVPCLYVVMISLSLHCIAGTKRNTKTLSIEPRSSLRAHGTQAVQVPVSDCGCSCPQLDIASSPSHSHRDGAKARIQKHHPHLH